MRERLGTAVVDWWERLYEGGAAAPHPLPDRLLAGVGEIWALRRVLLGLTGVITLAYWLPNPTFASLVFTAVQVSTLALCVAFAIALVWSAFGPLIRERFPTDGSAGLVAQCGVVAVATTAGVEVAVRLLATLPYVPPAAVQRLQVLPPTLLLALVTVAGLWLVRILRQQSRALAERDREALRARLEALQSRTQPHFLFNSLNMLAGLIEEDPPRAVVAVQKLAELLRHSLERSRLEAVPLEDEVAASRSYLELESLRFGERLRWSLDLDPAAAAAAVPPLCLQPLVENAIRHGLADRREGARVEVRAERCDGGVRLVVRDDGPGPGRSEQTGTRTGLADLRRRLEILYGGRATLEVRDVASGGCEVRLEIPDRQSVTREAVVPPPIPTASAP